MDGKLLLISLTKTVQSGGSGREGARTTRTEGGKRWANASLLTHLKKGIGKLGRVEFMGGFWVTS